MDTNGARAHTTPGEQEPSAEEGLRRLQEQVGELRAYFTYFVSAKIDGFKLSARQYAVWAALGVLGLIALAGLVIEAIVLVLVGAAAGFALLFNGRLWLGHIVVGSGVLVLLALGSFIGLRIWQRKSYQQKVQQYDARQVQQRATFGHSVADWATEDGAVPHP